MFIHNFNKSALEIKKIVSFMIWTVRGENRQKRESSKKEDSWRSGEPQMTLAKTVLEHAHSAVWGKIKF